MMPPKTHTCLSRNWTWVTMTQVLFWITKSRLLYAAAGENVWELFWLTSSDEVLTINTWVVMWLTCGNEKLVVDTWVVYIVHNTCEYRSKYLQVSEDVLHNNTPQSRLKITHRQTVIHMIHMSRNNCQSIQGSTSAHHHRHQMAWKSTDVVDNNVKLTTSLWSPWLIFKFPMLFSFCAHLFFIISLALCQLGTCLTTQSQVEML